MILKNKLNLFVTIIYFCTSSVLFSHEFTVASYNCGGLSDHYDYIRATCMQKLTQERYNEEPENMAQLEEIENQALKILFSTNSKEKRSAQNIWDQENYSEKLDFLIADPTKADSINNKWFEKSQNALSSYKERPILIHSKESKEVLLNQIRDVTGSHGAELHSETSLNEQLDLTRYIMAKRIFKHHMNYDIICLQEADYLDESVFPETHKVYFDDTGHSINGVAWNKQRFKLVAVLGDASGRGIVIQLKDTTSNALISVASGHLSGCNPFISIEENGHLDSEKGDLELSQIIQYLDSKETHIKVIAMDSNVTATHPRLLLMKEAGFVLDYLTYLEPTCSNPYQLFDTRIDWISAKSEDTGLKVTNIPVRGVGLNSPQTNISDHKPIAARISYSN